MPCCCKCPVCKEARRNPHNLLLFQLPGREDMYRHLLYGKKNLLDAGIPIFSHEFCVNFVGSMCNEYKTVHWCDTRPYFVDNCGLAYARP